MAIPFDLKKEVHSHEGELVELRRFFHRNPELGYQEFLAQSRIKEYLSALGITLIGMPKTGVCALIEGGSKGKTVLLRADMDALPVNEETGLPFSSANPGIMHACGHDGHTAMQLIAAKILAKHRDTLCGNVKLMFQPNEEEAGALDMINAGILESPKVDAAFALHLWAPIRTGCIGLNPGPVLGTTEEFELVIRGRAGHTAMPHESRGALAGACEIVSTLPGILRSEFDPLWPMAIEFGKLQSGRARNIIAEQAEAGGTIRFLFPDEKHNKPKVLEAFERVIKGICRIRELEYEIEFIPSNPSLVNDGALVALVRGSAEETFGRTGNIENFRSLAGEDFAEITQLVPSVMTFIGVRNEAKNSIYPHHHPKFDIDEDMLPVGVELQIRNVFNFLNRQE